MRALAVLPDGTWFRGLAAAHLRGHAAPRESSAEALIRRAARKAAVASGLAAAGVTGGALAALLSEGLAAPVGIPAGVLAIVLDAAYTALLGIDLVCDLGTIHGAPFRRPEDIAAVFADALGLGGSDGDGDLAARVGNKLMARAFVRDLPIAGLALGAAASYRTITALGAAAARAVNR